MNFKIILFSLLKQDLSCKNCVIMRFTLWLECPPENFECWTLANGPNKLNKFSKNLETNQAKNIYLSKSAIFTQFRGFYRKEDNQQIENILFQSKQAQPFYFTENKHKNISKEHEIILIHMIGFLLMLSIY